VAPTEPTIERNEEAHVSVAFHTPPAVEPEPVAETVPADPMPVVEPEPEPEAQPVATSAPVAPPDAKEAQFRIALCLEGGDEIDVAFFNDEAEAEAAARELIAGIAKDGEWPRVGNQFIRPERIVSVEIREQQRWTGSGARASWGTDAA